MRFIPTCTLILATAAASLFGQAPEPRQKQISVIGSVELKEVADQASTSFTLKGVGSSLHDAVADANKKVVSLTNRLVGIGVPPKNISTAQFYSGENYGDKKFLSSSRDFSALLTTMVKIDSLTLIDTVLYTISDADVQNLEGITFALKDELGLRRKARIAAAAKAREKAEDISASLGAVLGAVVTIEEIEPTKSVAASAGQPYLRGGLLIGRSLYAGYPNSYNPPSTPLFVEQTDIDESRGSGFFAQTVSMTSQVRVTFELK